MIPPLTRSPVICRTPPASASISPVEAFNEMARVAKPSGVVLLRDLCSGIQEPMQTKGRPRVSLADAVFCAAFKVYSGFSARRFTTDLPSTTTHHRLGRTNLRAPGS